MAFHKNEKGLTLLEVLLSISILIIILVSVMNFFPQMGLMNKQNYDKQQALNTAKEILFKWKDDRNKVKRLLNNQNSYEDMEYIEENENGFYVFIDKSQNGKYIVLIKIKKNSDLNEGNVNLHQIQIELQNENRQKITDIYGYVKVE